jgi:peptidoglycan hydrolase CwlO-like protein
MRRLHFLKIIFSIIVIPAIALPVFPILAQENSSATEERSALEKELKALEEQITQYEKDITKTAAEKKTLQNQLSVLKKKISQLNLQIQQGNVMIKDLGIQIKDTESSIDKTSLKVDDSKNKLSNILRTIYQEDQKSAPEILLSGKTLSDFFDNVVALEALNSKNQELLKEIRGLKVDLENQKNSLDDEKGDLEKVVKLQTLQKQQNESNQKNQQVLLGLTEAQYQQTLKQKQEAEKKAAEIRAKIFSLVGVTNAPTFGEAIDIAKTVSSVVDIRPAFLLAIISQESAIGRNVGQCVLTDSKTGAGKKISTGAVMTRLMKPTRDVSPFLEITAALGRDPYNTPVSCPLSIGWGGAMGPAQFIPSTWALFTDRLKAILGRPGDPWQIKDAFTASALYLSDLGASAKTASAEKYAAGRYYGSTASSYGSQVMKRATCIQNFIDTGTMSTECQELIL